MIVSLSWLRELVNTQASSEEIADKLSVSGLEVEHAYTWETVAGGLKGFVIGEVKTCAKHPNADKLSVTTVDIGLPELQPIVCGAPNVAAGQKVVVATVGTDVTVPGKGSFTIGEAKIRGEVSRGMICAEDEMGLGTSHDGILVLPNEAKVGTAAADYFKVVSDEMLEIGLTANRGDAASHLGVARDVAALFNTQITLPKIEKRPLSTGKFKITAQPEHCSLYFGLQAEGVKSVPSPDLVQNRLRAIGIEPKNILVDAGNYAMHALGQPVHVFDADKIVGDNIEVRLAVKGEKVTTLDKVERECKGGELVIADGSGIIALAGVMGGLHSAVSESTSRIFIESAHFNPGLVRKTARAHGLSTDASFRFERSTDPEMCIHAALYTFDLIATTAGGNIVGSNQCQAAEYAPRTIDLDMNKLQAFAGADVPKEEALKILNNLGFVVETQENTWKIAVPSWRNDVTEVVDLYEEILRIYGYDRIALTGKMKASLPEFKGIAAFKKQEIASRFLVGNGFFEIMNNSLSNGQLYENESDLVKLNNPLSADMEYMRGSLLPGMLQAAAYNRNRKNQNIRFFEFGRTYRKTHEGFEEPPTLGILMGGNESNESWETKSKAMDFYYAKRMATNLLNSLGVACDPETLVVIERPSAELMKKFDLDGEFWYAEINWSNTLMAIKNAAKLTVQQPPKFPYMRRDLSLVVDKSMKFSDIKAAIVSEKSALLKNMGVFDVFEGKPLDEGKKAIAISFYLGTEDATLTDEIADSTMAKIIAACEKAGAVIRR
ncbi:MAG: phenylalanine--tRNA ligase subunit beta [Bacteroidia bacterium]|nr:phenylalanine--tRNA ligase subunit beta [Bacteroidia bacterium]